MRDKPKVGRLFLIPTVIAPDTALQVLTPQIPDTVNTLTYFLVENVRTARRFLSSIKVAQPIDSLDFQLLDKRTAIEEIPPLFRPVFRGHDMGILSEAGCPGVADPGAKAVAYAHQHDVQVIPLVGPSSILLALMASGLSGQSFAFHGYLPIDKGERKQAIKKLEKEAIQRQQTQIFMETPYRNQQLLGDILSCCQKSTRLCIARNVTAPDELIRTKTIQQWEKISIDLHKVPTVFLLFV